MVKSEKRIKKRDNKQQQTSSSSRRSHKSHKSSSTNKSGKAKGKSKSKSNWGDTDTESSSDDEDYGSNHYQKSRSHMGDSYNSSNNHGGWANSKSNSGPRYNSPANMASDFSKEQKSTLEQMFPTTSREFQGVSAKVQLPGQAGLTDVPIPPSVLADWVVNRFLTKDRPILGKVCCVKGMMSKDPTKIDNWQPASCCFFTQSQYQAKAHLFATTLAITATNELHQLKFKKSPHIADVATGKKCLKTVNRRLNHPAAKAIYGGVPKALPFVAKLVPTFDPKSKVSKRSKHGNSYSSSSSDSSSDDSNSSSSEDEDTSQKSKKSKTKEGKQPRKGITKPPTKRTIKAELDESSGSGDDTGEDDDNTIVATLAANVQSMAQQLAKFTSSSGTGAGSSSSRSSPTTTQSERKVMGSPNTRRTTQARTAASAEKANRDRGEPKSKRKRSVPKIEKFDQVDDDNKSPTQRARKGTDPLPQRVRKDRGPKVRSSAAAAVLDDIFDEDDELQEADSGTIPVSDHPKYASLREKITNKLSNKNMKDSPSKGTGILTMCTQFDVPGNGKRQQVVDDLAAAMIRSKLRAEPDAYRYDLWPADEDDE